MHIRPGDNPEETKVAIQPRELALRRRGLQSDDPSLLSLVEIGAEPWEQEVELFLRTESILREERGDCHTTVYLLEEEERVVGFITTTPAHLEVDSAFRAAFGLSNRRAPRSPVGAVYLLAIGVDKRFQGQGIGSRMHADLIDSISTGMVGARFLVLKVWEDSPALRLYERWGYRTLGSETGSRGRVRRRKMVLDRWTEQAG